MTAPSENIFLDAPLLSGISSAVNCSTSPKIVMFLLLLRGWRFFCFSVYILWDPILLHPKFKIEFLPSSVQGHADLFIFRK